MMAFTAGVGWRRQGWGDNNPVSESLAHMWIIFQPLLFSLIGAEIQVMEMSLSTVGWGLLVLLAGLSSRTVAAYLAVSGGENNYKEKIFVSLAWLPKATVQAALGPVALGKAKESLAKYMAENPSTEVCSSEVITDKGETD